MLLTNAKNIDEQNSPKSSSAAAFIPTLRFRMVFLRRERGGGGTAPATDAAAQNFNRLASSPSWSLGCSAFAYRKTHRSINGISKMMGATKAA